MTQIYSYEKIRNDMRLVELLSQSVPDIGAACTEIINLEAILNLPKGTEHFLADIHGEYEAFQHILKNASGNIKRKVNEIFGTTMRESEIRQLCSLIYYPEQKLQYIKNSETNLNDFYNITLHQLVSVCQSVSSKYTRSKVRKALPKEFAYIIEELLHESPQDYNKQAYFNRIIETIVSTGRADEFICAICNLIQRLSIDQLHILGDIFDRGPGAHIIMDTLCNYHNFDIQWGNHDALWMGAAAGNDCCSLTATSPHWKTVTASIWCRLPRSPWKHTPTTPAIISGRNWTKTTRGITRKPGASSHRCTRPSALSSSSSKLP